MNFVRFRLPHSMFRLLNSSVTPDRRQIEQLLASCGFIDYGHLMKCIMQSQYDDTKAPILLVRAEQFAEFIIKRTNAGFVNLVQKMNAEYFETEVTPLKRANTSVQVFDFSNRHRVKSASPTVIMKVLPQRKWPPSVWDLIHSRREEMMLKKLWLNLPVQAGKTAGFHGIVNGKRVP
jgi:hypothetical protein